MRIICHRSPSQASLRRSLHPFCIFKVISSECRRYQQIENSVTLKMHLFAT